MEKLTKLERLLYVTGVIIYPILGFFAVCSLIALPIFVIKLDFFCIIVLSLTFLVSYTVTKDISKTLKCLREKMEK